MHFFYALKNVRSKDESQNSAYCKQLCLVDELGFNSPRRCLTIKLSASLIFCILYNLNKNNYLFDNGSDLWYIIKNLTKKYRDGIHHPYE